MTHGARDVPEPTGAPPSGRPKPDLIEQKVTMTQEADVDLDDLTGAELSELDGPAHTVAGVLLDWLWLTRQIPPNRNHSVGTFLDLLAAEGYRVEKIEAPELAELMPAATD